MSQRMRQKEEGFKVLANLKRAINIKRNRHEIYQDALGMVLANTGIDAAVVLEEDRNGDANVVAAAGYNEDEVARLKDAEIAIPEELGHAGFLIGNKRDRSAVLETLRSSLRLPYNRGCGQCRYSNDSELRTRSPNRTARRSADCGD